ncbi:hypothetical protein TELCIR_15870, partial [Teladorsagia circumcincta]
MLPGYSPWMRNAGRKKSHPVWEFFKDLKDTSLFIAFTPKKCPFASDHYRQSSSFIIARLVIAHNV